MVSKKLLSLGVITTAFTPLIAVVSCGDDSQEVSQSNIDEVKNFIKELVPKDGEVSLESNFVQFPNAQNIARNYESADYVYYMLYLMAQRLWSNSHHGEDNPLYEITSYDNIVNLHIGADFKTRQGDSRLSSAGRTLPVAHGGHYHYYFVTWEEKPPTPEELRELNGWGMDFKFTVENGKIDWTKVIAVNGMSDIYVPNKVVSLAKGTPKKPENLDVFLNNPTFEVAGYETHSSM